jgi:hypothetical protein
MMTFTFTNYAAIQPQASPYQDFIGKILGGYSDMTKAKYLQPGLEEELKKNKLFNEYYGPNIESEIGLRKAQTGEAGARTGLLGEQTKGAKIENQYMPRYKEAQIQQLQAQAEKARLLQNIREYMMGGGLPGTQNNQNPSMPIMQGQGMPSEQTISNSNGQPAQTGLNYPSAVTMMQALGLGKPQVVNANGKYMAITPFGNFDTGVSGLNARDTALSKEDAKKISKLEDLVLSSSKKQDTFDAINEDLVSPQFAAIRQRPELGRHELAWYEKFGTKGPGGQQELIGRLKANLGEVVKNAASDFKGQFRIGEQGLVNSMKPNESDSLDVMKGKAEAMTYLNKILLRRSELEADLMRNQGMSALEARIAADKQIDPKKIKKEVHTILHPTKKRDITPEQALAELQRRQAEGNK